MVLDHNPAPAGSRHHFELATMTHENVSDSPGPPPEGYMEGQACVFVIRKVERRVQGWETDEKSVREGAIPARLSPHSPPWSSRLYKSYCTRLLECYMQFIISNTLSVCWGSSRFWLLFSKWCPATSWDSSLLTVRPAKGFCFCLCNVHLRAFYY